jgi:hypothetical protein
MRDWSQGLEIHRKGEFRHRRSGSHAFSASAQRVLPSKAPFLCRRSYYRFGMWSWKVYQEACALWLKTSEKVEVCLGNASNRACFENPQSSPDFYLLLCMRAGVATDRISPCIGLRIQETQKRNVLLSVQQTYLSKGDRRLCGITPAPDLDVQSCSRINQNDHSFSFSVQQISKSEPMYSWAVPSHWQL